MKQFLKTLVRFMVPALAIIVAVIVALGIVIGSFIAPNEVNIENCRKLFGVLRNIQIFDMMIGIVLCAFLVIIVFVALRSYSTYKQSYREIEKAQKELQETSKLYDPQNAGGVIKPLYDKASEFIDREKSPFIPLINSAQDHLSKSQKALDQITDFKQDAHEIITCLYQTEPLLKNLVVIPEKYSRFIKEVKDEAKVKIDKLKLMGSMVGFYCLLPLSIRNHFCETPCNVAIDLLATDHELHAIGGNHGNLWLYPLGLVAKSLYSIATQCKKNWNDPRTIAFGISYLPYDILEALLIVGNHKLVSLQALSPENIDIIFSKRQVGVIVKKNDPDKQFDRYVEAFLNTYNTVKKQVRWECWMLRVSNKQMNELRIEGNPHWQYNKATKIITFNNQKEYDAKAEACLRRKGHPTTSIPFDNESDIKEFLEKFSTTLSSSGLVNINENIKAHPNLSTYPCLCQ